MIVAVTLLAAFGIGMGLAYLAFDAAGYRPLRRAIARGDVDVSPGTELRPFTLNALGGNPDIEYRYLPYEVPEGHVCVLTAWVAPNVEYYSVVAYDRLLQSVLPERCPGPTLLAGRHLRLDDEGRFVAVLARTDRGWPHFLDISAVPSGVLFERHIGAAPAQRATIEVVPEAEALRRFLPAEAPAITA